MIKNIRLLKYNEKYTISMDHSKISSKNNLNTESNTHNSNISNKKDKTSNLNYSKLKFNQNILLNLLKKSSFSINHKIHTKSTSTSINSKFKNSIYDNKKILNKLSKNNVKYKNIPGISKLHNLTDIKINNIINNNNDFNYYYSTPIKSYMKTQTFSSNKEKLNLYTNKNNINLSPTRGSSSNKKNSSSEISSNKKLIFLHKNNAKQKLLKEIYEDINLNTVNQEKKIKFLFPNTLCKSSKKIKYKKNHKFKYINEDYSTNDNNNPHNKWMTSFNTYLRKFGLMNRSSQIDRLLFSVEKPDECFEENVYLGKPGDKYQLFKNQINKHKNKIDHMIFDMKLNQKKNDILMRRYIFKILSQRNKNK